MVEENRRAAVEQIQTVVGQGGRLLPRGGGTKPALSTPVDEVTTLDLSGLSGVLEYNPSEFTFTALAGTPVAQVQAMLAERGQYLPFDPPLAEAGATLGGTVAAGVSGPGRYRYGGVRDFILEVHLVDGQGRLVRGGGKVVKNSAGFDIPKLMVGSLGQMGVLVELTFKVFPQSPAYVTIRHQYGRLEEAVEALGRLYTGRMDIDALELVVEPDGSGLLLARLGGLSEALPARAGRIQALLPGGQVLTEGAEVELWQEARRFAWVPSEWNLVKVPLTPRRILELDASLGKGEFLRRYSAGGNVAWIATPEPPQTLEKVLASLRLGGLLLFGPPGQALLGARPGELFERRIKAVLDPHYRLGGGYAAYNSG